MYVYVLSQPQYFARAVSLGPVSAEMHRSRTFFISASYVGTAP